MELARRIGSLTLKNPFVLGGLSGYAEQVFRRECASMGAGAIVLPMLLDQALLTFGKKPRTRPVAPTGERPAIAQVLPSDPEQAAQAALLLQEVGFDAVEVNMACPSPKILRRERGGALMSMPERAIRTAKAVKAALSIPVSAKIRAGFDSSLESRDCFHRILDGLLAIPLDMITIHARTVEQRYKGRADWELLAAAKKRAGSAVIAGSGDLFEPGDAVRMLDQTGVDIAAAGRGAISNPWFFPAAIAAARGEPFNTPTALKLDWLLRYCREVFAAHRKGKGLAYARKTCIKAARLLPEPKKSRIAFCSASTIEEFEGIILGMSGKASEEIGSESGQ